MSELWMYRAFGQDFGPISFSELQDLAATGVVSADSEVRELGALNWQQAGSVAGLKPTEWVTSQPQALKNMSSRSTEPTKGTDDWYCRVGKLEFGPLTFGELIDMAKSEQLAFDDEVRFGAAGKWRLAGSIGRLMAVLPYQDVQPKVPITTNRVINSNLATPRQTSVEPTSVRANAVQPIEQQPIAHSVRPVSVATSPSYRRPAVKGVPPRHSTQGTFGNLKEVTQTYRNHLIAIGVATILSAWWFYPRTPVRPVAVHPVKGRVVIDGQPLANAAIVLHHVGNQKAKMPANLHPHAKAAADGTFALETFAKADGAPEGEFVATVFLVEETTEADGERSFGPNLLPAQYCQVDTSPFRLKITAATKELEPLRLTRQ